MYHTHGMGYFNDVSIINLIKIAVIALAIIKIGAILPGHFFSSARKFQAKDIPLSLLRIGLGAFFIINSITKFTPDALGDNAAFLTNSRLLPEAFSMPLTCIGIMMELVVGVCLIARIDYRGSALWGTVMAGVFFLLFAQAWARGLELSCACSGSNHQITDYPMETGARLLLLAAMLLLLWDSRRQQSRHKRFKGKTLDFSDAV